jgi:hypothetical protein
VSKTSRHSIQPPDLSGRTGARPADQSAHAGVPEPPAVVPADQSAHASVPPPPPKAPAWNWQLVIFLWATSFVFLALYEFLWTFLRAVSR